MSKRMERNLEQLKAPTRRGVLAALQRLRLVRIEVDRAMARANLRARRRETVEMEVERLASAEDSVRITWLDKELLGALTNWEMFELRIDAAVVAREYRRFLYAAAGLEEAVERLRSRLEPPPSEEKIDG